MKTLSSTSMLSGRQTSSRILLRHFGMTKAANVCHGLIVHALHKSASMFLHKFFQNLCYRKSIPYYSIHNSTHSDKSPPDNVAQSFVLGPVRSFDIGSYDFPNVDRQTHLIQIRDPRDILVSEYYSLGWIHTDREWSDDEKRLREQIREIGIDEFVSNHEKYSKYPLLDRYLPILDLVEQSNVKIVRYEDMVLNFEAWLETVLDVAELFPRSRWRSRLLNQYRDEFKPGGAEDPHKRNVTPGDHKSKLKATTIEKLNSIYAPVLKRMAYEH